MTFNFIRNYQRCFAKWLYKSTQVFIQSGVKPHLFSSLCPILTNIAMCLKSKTRHKLTALFWSVSETLNCPPICPPVLGTPSCHNSAYNSLPHFSLRYFFESSYFRFKSHSDKESFPHAPTLHNAFTQQRAPGYYWRVQCLWSQSSSRSANTWHAAATIYWMNQRSKEKRRAPSSLIHKVMGRGN